VKLFCGNMKFPTGFLADFGLEVTFIDLLQRHHSTGKISSRIQCTRSRFHIFETKNCYSYFYGFFGTFCTITCLILDICNRDLLYWIQDEILPLE